MKNVTITLDPEVARWARVYAAQHDTSVSLKIENRRLCLGLALGVAENVVELGIGLSQDFKQSPQFALWPQGESDRAP